MDTEIANALKNLEREENSQKFIEMINEIVPVKSDLSSEKMVRLLRQLEKNNPPTLLAFCPSSILLLRLHSLLCALRNKTEDKQKFFAIGVGYLFPVALEKERNNNN